MLQISNFEMNSKIDEYCQTKLISLSFLAKEVYIFPLMYHLYDQIRPFIKIFFAQYYLKSESEETDFKSLLT